MLKRNPHLLIAGILQLILSLICAFIGVLALSGTITSTKSSPRLIIAETELILSITALTAFTLGFIGAIQTLKQTRYLVSIIGAISLIAWNIYAINYIYNTSSPTNSQATISTTFFMIQTLTAIITAAFIATSKTDYK